MFFNILKHTLKNIIRNKFLTFSSILVIWLLIFFINILVVMKTISFDVIKNINSKISIDLYLKENLDNKSIEVRKFEKEIKELNPNIKIKYMDKKEILNQAQKKSPEVLNIINWIDNPFPNTYFLSNIDINDYAKLDKIIKKRMKWPDAIFDESEWNKILWIKKVENNYKDKISKIDKITLALKSLWFWIYFIIFIFVSSIFIIIYSIIWNFIFHYRNEIYITKLIWWSKRFIYWPFVLQWIFYSLIALFLSLILFYYLLNNLPHIFSNFDIKLDFDVKDNILPIIKKLLPLEIIAFTFIWAISWFLSTRKYSKEIKY